MGLFSKKSEKAPVPPMPPIGQTGLNESSSGLVPPKKAEASTLTPPPIPGGSLADIKNQVSTSKESSSLSSISQPNKMPELPPITTPVEEKQGTEMDLPSLDDDSLFDFSDIHTQESDDSIDIENHESNPDSTDLNDLSFIQNSEDKKRDVQDTYFVTTKQFKSLLEIVDQVKRKVKESSDTHLRLMDIKSEEDIEYENLRKDFEFIEDKLYEVDSILFDK